eukprot:c4616_g1_i1.p1 GENE.c4616_g1_i1~~c4616_g1_i1.p1  ORF type:complete len:211 (+),score=41.19 c4616_g1_i1:60-635(+)
MAENTQKTKITIPKLGRSIQIPKVTFGQFIIGIGDDLRIILVGILNVGFWICSVVGLSLVPYGIDKIPAPKLALQATICTWSLLSGLICLIGSAARNRSVLLSSIMFIAHVIITLTCGAFMLAETLYTCRHCGSISDLSCKSWYHDCDIAYGVYLVGTVGTIVCQYVMMFIANSRRDIIEKKLHESSPNMS